MTRRRALHVDMQKDREHDGVPTVLLRTYISTGLRRAEVAAAPLVRAIKLMFEVAVVPEGPTNM